MGPSLRLPFHPWSNYRVSKAGHRSTVFRIAGWISLSGASSWNPVARQKPLHLQRQQAASRLADRLFDPARGEDLIVQMVDPTVDEDCDTICDLSRWPGIWVDERPDKWEVRSEPIKREVGVLLSSELDPPPAWWSDGQARGFTVCSAVAGPSTVTASAQVRVFFGIPSRRT